MKTHNLNCDGEFCKSKTGEIRVLPVSKDSNALLCQACFNHEVIWHRKIKSAFCDVSVPEDLPTWDSLKVYETRV
jgi:hypothetical protein